MKQYECESCGYLICAERTPKKCPNCRARVLEMGECREGLTKIKCPECSEIFYYDSERGKPFKCAFCDHVFGEKDYF
ncbi:MAG: hypothetical protein U9N35_04860 [Euryarchaeota archaeon]|nr:hypothetical protein [Euryarchaeota archaeon]